VGNRVGNIGAASPGTLDRRGPLRARRRVSEISRTKKPLLTFINLYTYDADMKFFTDHLYSWCRSPRGNSRLHPSKRQSVFVLTDGGGRHYICR